MNDTVKTDDPVAALETAEAPPAKPVEVVRSDRGRFVRGHSGNPVGRTKGTKNRITLARLMLEEDLRKLLTRSGKELMSNAIQMALNGDEKIMRVLLDKMLATPKGDDAENARDTEIKVSIHNMTSGAPAATKVEATNVRLTMPNPPKGLSHAQPVTA